MRYTALTVLLVVATSPLRAQTPSRMDEPIQTELRIDKTSGLAPCEIGSAFDEFARQTGFPIGFEAASDCWLSGRMRAAGASAEILTNMSVRQALEHLVTLTEGYRWKEMNGVAVIRPEAAWTATENLLNLPTRPFNATTDRLHDVLQTALHAVASPVYIPSVDVREPGPIARNTPVTFSGGTLLEALNEIVRAQSSAMWQIGYGQRGATIAVSTLDFPGDVVFGSLHRQ